MSGGDVDVEPFLVSLNTLGNDEPQLKFSSGMQWWSLMKKQPSLSSRNTLGDSNHNSNNHKYQRNQKWVSLWKLYVVVRKLWRKAYAKDVKMGKILWSQMVVKPR